MIHLFCSQLILPPGGPKVHSAVYPEMGEVDILANLRLSQSMLLITKYLDHPSFLQTIYTYTPALQG